MEEKTTADEMPGMWEDLVLKSKNIDASLVVVKKKFTEVNALQYKSFAHFFAKRINV